MLKSVQQFEVHADYRHVIREGGKQSYKILSVHLLPTFKGPVIPRFGMREQLSYLIERRDFHFGHYNYANSFVQAVFNK